MSKVSPFVLGALTLNDSGRIQLEGRQMPKGLSAILQAPFLGMSGGALNGALAASSKVPGVRDVALPSTGLPVLTHDAAAAAKFAQHATLEGVVARPAAMTAANEDLARVRELIANGQGPRGKVYIIHGDRDPLASPQASRDVAQQLGERAHLQMLKSANHILEESPTEQGHILAGMQWLAGKS
jgi:pimeloyl-ACP methyl ester carboxylesterase